MIEAPERTEELLVEEPAAPRRPAPPPDLVEPDTRQAVRELFTTGLAVFLAVAAAGWMCAGIFKGWPARAVAVAGALVGSGLVAASYRSRRPAMIQYLVLPIAIVLGAILVLPDTRGGGASLPGLVAEAIRIGGIAQPPIPFDPGWRFILLILMAVLGAASGAVALSLDRPRLGSFMPLPLLFGAALIQPKESALVTSLVALLFVIASLAVSYGVELGREGALSGQFELRRYARGLLVIVLIGGGLALLSRAGFLFPEPRKEQVVPSKKPEVQPQQSDRVLFSVRSKSPGPWRLGVLDVYADNAWLLPPFDLERLEPVDSGGAVPEYEGAPKTEGPPGSATFVLSGMEGHLIPSPAGATAISRRGFEVEFDPRTQTFRLPERRAGAGMTYTIRSAAQPTGVELAQAPPPPEHMKPYLEAPIQPNEVVTLLAQAPATNQWDRLQFVRATFYNSVVAAGAGTPVDVPPSRVVDMLAGKEATPYEITAAEALLARWSGVPARIGYGFHKGDKDDASAEVWEVHPRHGATWLEAYFEGHGWIPVVGTPPRARASLSDAERNRDPAVRPSEQLALTVYVPVKLQSIRLLYIAVRYWTFFALPFVAASAFVMAFYPGLVKAVRRRKRRRWTERFGPRERIAAAYAEMRDSANDLNIGDSSTTPLGFLEALEEDIEHRELAWLVTRAIWGDLKRDLRDEDANVAEELARSVTRRLKKAQPLASRVISIASRASLRSPYSQEVPNLWPHWARKGLVRRSVGSALRPLLKPLKAARRIIPIGSVLIVTVLVASACQRAPEQASGRSSLPKNLGPGEFQGFTIQAEPEAESSFGKVDEGDSLVRGGKVFTIRSGDDVLGSLQAAVFKPGYAATRREVREGVLNSIGSGRFDLTRIAGERIYVKKLPEQTVYLWFPLDGGYYELMVARQGFEQAGRLFAALIAYQRGEEPSQLSEGASVELVDPRRGENG